MPIPAAPPVPLRRRIEHALGALNCLVLATLGMSFAVEVLWWFVGIPLWLSGFLALVPFLHVAIPAVLAVYGFLGRGHHQLRAWLVLPSGIGWALASLVARAGRRTYVRHVPYGGWRDNDRLGANGVLALAMAIVAALTIESCVARLRVARARRATQTPGGAP
jgi:hypothetical protein